MRPTQRGKLLVRLAEIIEREAERLGELEVRDNGKLIAEKGRHGLGEYLSRR